MTKFYRKFLGKSKGERILKIDQQLPVFFTNNTVGLFYDLQCIFKMFLYILFGHILW